MPVPNTRHKAREQADSGLVLAPFRTIFEKGGSMAYADYKAKKFQLSGLEGISDKTLEMHFGLYEGYVKNTNLLMEQISAMSRKKQASGQDPAYAELTRRLGFEFGGMVLHEYYFENLAPKGKGSPSGNFKKAVDESFDGFENWQQAFSAVGSMRGVGWAILYQDPATETLEPLDSAASGRSAFGVQADSRHGCVGACVSSRLQARRAWQVYQRFF